MNMTFLFSYFILWMLLNTLMLPRFSVLEHMTQKLIKVMHVDVHLNFHIVPCEETSRGELSEDTQVYTKVFLVEKPDACMNSPPLLICQIMFYLCSLNKPLIINFNRASCFIYMYYECLNQTLTTLGQNH